VILGNVVSIRTRLPRSHYSIAGNARDSIPKCTDGLWHPPNFLFSGYCGLFPRD